MVESEWRLKNICIIWVSKMGETRTGSLVEQNKPYIFLISITLFSLLLFAFADNFQQPYHKVMGPDLYLTWHSLFEIASVLVSFTNFAVYYFTFNMTGRVRTLVICNFLLVVGFIDIFHTLSFKGMPAFFIENVTANRATTFWIIARLLAAVGFLATSFIRVNKRFRKTGYKRNIFLIVSLLATLAIFYTVTYQGQLLPAMFIEGSGLTETKKYLEYGIILLLAVAAVKHFVEYFSEKDFLSVLLCGSMVLSIFSEFALTNYSQVYDIYNYIGHVYKIIAYFLLFRVIFIRNVQRPYIELSVAQQKLRDYADNLDRVVEQRTMQLKKVNRRLMSDLEYARDIQKAMLPAVIPDIPGLSFASMYYPADRLSGDFYDIFKLDDQHLGFYICDVSGHGVPAAMLTVYLKQCMEARRETDMNSGIVSPPSKVLRSVFDSYNSTSFNDEVYIVLIYAVYNFNTKELVYSSAGMNVEPLLIREDGTVSHIPLMGLPICKVKGFYEAEYDDNRLELKKGDKLMFYTDGLIDAKSVKNIPYTQERLEALLKSNSGCSGKEIVETVKDDLYNFINGKKIVDDITFFVLDTET